MGNYVNGLFFCGFHITRRMTADTFVNFSFQLRENGGYSGNGHAVKVNLSNAAGNGDIQFADKHAVLETTDNKDLMTRL